MSGDLDSLKAELIIEQLKYFRAMNEERKRQQREHELEKFLAKKYGYSFPRRRGSR
jgi:hypothetical protein